jgi:hypothetical protein
MKKIIIKAKVSYVYVTAIEVKNGEVQTQDLSRLEIIGEHVTEKKALKVAKEKHTNGTYIPNLVLRCVEHLTNEYEISMEDVIKYGTKIEKPEAE